MRCWRTAARRAACTPQLVLLLTVLLLFVICNNASERDCIGSAADWARTNASAAVPLACHAAGEWRDAVGLPEPKETRCRRLLNRMPRNNVFSRRTWRYQRDGVGRANYTRPAGR